MASKWFPDLQRVESGSAQDALWSAAYRPVLRSPAYWLIALVTHVAAQIVIGVPFARLARHWGFYSQPVGFMLPSVVAVLAVVLIVWLVRRRITRNLREELTKQGMPTCVKCGYNLTGNVSGTCPECGKKVKA